MGRLFYDRIAQRTQSFFKQQTVNLKTHVPNPNQTDYKRGFILRYFLQKTSDPNSAVYEVSDGTYVEFMNNDLFIKCSIEWKISGDLEEIKKINSQTLLTVYTKMPALTKYLVNLGQFSKNNLDI